MKQMSSIKMDHSTISSSIQSDTLTDGEKELHGFILNVRENITTQVSIKDCRPFLV